ncbi:hypothetical protein AAVH_03280 [Aphelenchoides avenae]|nr:hypothetical protein AAVH_03280 [Aphelenchus avenae]
MDFVHCNSCGRTPSRAEPAKFFLTSCLHILCGKCANKDQGNGRDVVCACKKPARIQEIGRSMSPQTQMLFRDTKDLATQFVQNLQSVLCFQQQQRARLRQATEAKFAKSLKYARTEAQKKAEIEKALMAERDQLKAHLDDREEELIRMRAEADRLRQENQQLKSHGTPKNKRFPSLNGATPLNSASFLPGATSTPLNADGMGTPYGQQRFRDEVDFFANLDSLGNSPLTSGSMDFLSTPAMLGLAKR